MPGFCWDIGVPASFVASCFARVIFSFEQWLSGSCLLQSACLKGEGTFARECPNDAGAVLARERRASGMVRSCVHCGVGVGGQSLTLGPAERFGCRSEHVSLCRECCHSPPYNFQCLSPLDMAMRQMLAGGRGVLTQAICTLGYVQTLHAHKVQCAGALRPSAPTAP